MRGPSFLVQSVTEGHEIKDFTNIMHCILCYAAKYNHVILANRFKYAKKIMCLGIILIKTFKISRLA